MALALSLIVSILFQDVNLKRRELKDNQKSLFCERILSFKKFIWKEITQILGTEQKNLIE